MALRAIGRRYRFPTGIMAEVFDSGTVILRRGTSEEFFDANGEFNSTNDVDAKLWVELGQPINIREYANLHGRPRGTIWGE